MKNRILSMSAILGLALQAFAAMAASDDAIDALSRRIAESSSSVRSLLLQQEAEVESMKADNVLPNPEVEFESLWAKGASKYSGSVSQEFELPSAYRMRSRAARSGLAAVEFIRESALMEKTLEAKQLIIDYVYQKRRLKALEVIRQNLDSLAASTEKGFKGGELTILDVRKIKIERAGIMRDIAEAQIAMEETIGKINVLADGGKDPLDFSPALAEIDDYPSLALNSLEFYEENALARNPSLMLNAARIDAARDLEKSMAAERLPSFGLGYAFEREEGSFFNGFRVSVSLPFWKGSARRKAAKLEVTNLQLQEEAAIVAKKAQIRGLYKAAKTGETALAERVEALGALSGNDSWTALLKRALDGGRISMLEYLNETNFFLDAVLQLEDARHAQALLLSELNQNSHAGL